nr:HAD family hydrolase [Clostridia bacterium]
MATLYLSDLDGTLLRSDQRTSVYTNETINRLVEEGMIFSYATARSFNTARKVAEGLNAKIPLIVYNGAFIINNVTHELIQTNLFSEAEAAEILQELLAAGTNPIVYCLDDKERFVYNRSSSNDDTREYVDSRAGDSRDTPVHNNDDLSRTGTFYFTCIDDEEKLAPLNERYRDRFTCMFAKDIYSGAQWLEIMPKAATKAHAARQLAKLLGCDRIVAFGDAVNDIPLFDAATECYAVSNAADALKERATAVIGCNDEDGVARWLEKNWKK